MATLTLLVCLLLTVAYGSEIILNSTSSFIKPLITRDITIKCSLRDTTPSGTGGLVGRSLPDADMLQSTRKQHTKKVLNSVLESIEAAHPTLRHHSKRSSLTNISENIDFITSIVISKDDIDLATITARTPAQPVVNSHGLVVTGSLTGQSPEPGFLQITWSKPTDLQVGTYRCDVDTLNSAAHSIDFSQSVQVAEHEVSLNDLVNYVTEVERDKDAIGNHLRDIEAATNKTIANMKSENAALKQRITELEGDVAQLNTTVAFTAQLTHSTTLSNGERLIFDKTLTNVGQGYQASSGIFTCPKSGLYIFVVHLTSTSGEIFISQLRHNNITVMEISKHSAVSGYLGISNSAIINLQKGDTVDVSGRYTTSNLYGSSSQVRTSFSGHLIGSS